MSDPLRKQLEDIASASPGGKVPLHGRLFAQWLHYAFPQDCPFPHKAGATVALTPNEFGDRYLSSEEDMIAHVAAKPGEAPTEDDADMFAAWSHEEELLSDHTHLHAPWESRFPSSFFFVLLIIGAALGYVKVNSLGRSKSSGGLLPTSAPYMKVHSC